MTGKRPNEPIGPTTIPGQPLDPKIPADQQEPDVEESDQEQQARESEKAFDQAITRIPPG
jgi:hypothetical protein